MENFRAKKKSYQRWSIEIRFHLKSHFNLHKLWLRWRSERKVFNFRDGWNLIIMSEFSPSPPRSLISDARGKKIRPSPSENWIRLLFIVKAVVGGGGNLITEDHHFNFRSCKRGKISNYVYSGQLPNVPIKSDIDGSTTNKARLTWIQSFFLAALIGRLIRFSCGK